MTITNASPKAQHPQTQGSGIHQEDVDCRQLKHSRAPCSPTPTLNPRALYLHTQGSRTESSVKQRGRRTFSHLQTSSLLCTFKIIVLHGPTHTTERGAAAQQTVVVSSYVEHPPTTLQHCRRKTWVRGHTQLALFIIVNYKYINRGGPNLFAIWHFCTSPAVRRPTDHDKGRTTISEPFCIKMTDDGPSKNTGR